MPDSSYSILLNFTIIKDNWWEHDIYLSEITGYGMLDCSSIPRRAFSHHYKVKVSFSGDKYTSPFSEHRKFLPLE